MKILSKKALCVMALLTTSTCGFAQESLVPDRGGIVRKPIVIPGNLVIKDFSKEQLGTKKEVMDLFTKNLAVAVRRSLPSYNEKKLGSFIQTIAKRYGKSGPGLNFKTQSLEKTFKRTIDRDRTVQEDDFLSHISTQKGEIEIYQDLSHLKPMDLGRGQKMMRKIGGLHLSLAQELGVKKSDLLYFNTTLLNLQAVKNLGGGKTSRPTKAVVDHISSYGLRKLGGILVEGSFIKMFSKNEKNIAGVEFKWPKFNLHPGLKRFALKSKSQLLEETLKHLNQTVNKRHEVNVKMAVAFRPVTFGKKITYVPALKVGMYSRPDAKREAEGEAGELFYIDLMKQKLSYLDPQLKDQAQSRD